MRNRRQFLKDAAGASAGMFFLGSGAYGSQPAVPAPQSGSNGVKSVSGSVASKRWMCTVISPCRKPPMS